MLASSFQPVITLTAPFALSSTELRMSKTLAHTHRDDLSTREHATKHQTALYVVLEGERPLAGGLRASMVDVDSLKIGRGDARTCRIDSKERSAVLEIPDRRMSSKHARLVREEGAWLIEDLGSTNGMFVGGKRVKQALLEEPTVITLGATCLLFHPTDPIPSGGELPIVTDTSTAKSRPRGMSTLVPAVEQGMPRLLRVSISKLSVLLLGETGVGKEVLARAIHTLSGRTGPFVAINCGALAPTLVESQLFGHVKGAFSGALKDEPGLVRSASGGTLFLDEIGELPQSAQATLLRVLQENEVLPVGGTKPVPVDLRVVSATLKAIDDEGSSFRADLFARVAAYVHRLTPLRERRGDIGMLIADLLPRVAGDRASSIRFHAELATALVTHDFPLNVRELEHILSVALVTTEDPLLTLSSVGTALKRPAPQAPAAAPGPTPASSTGKDRRALTEEELQLRERLKESLTRTKGNVSEIAREMGKTRMQIHRWMKRFDLDPESFRD